MFVYKRCVPSGLCMCVEVNVVYIIVLASHFYIFVLLVSVLFQVPGEGKPRGAAVHHPESYEGQQPEGLHA